MHQLALQQSARMSLVHRLLWQVEADSQCYHHMVSMHGSTSVVMRLFLEVLLPHCCWVLCSRNVAVSEGVHVTARFQHRVWAETNQRAGCIISVSVQFVYAFAFVLVTPVNSDAQLIQSRAHQQAFLPCH